MELVNKKVSLDHLYLDPNNYRFIDQPDYSFVEEKDIKTTAVQKKTLRFLSGASFEGIKDLLDSIKTNGFLEFEQIQVRPISSTDYVVVEGNRRVAALKTLNRQYEAENQFEEFKPTAYTKIQVSIIQGYDEKNNYIAMGLQHIGGKKKWSPLNQARLLRDLLTKQRMGENEICNSLGITRSTFRTRLRALYLADIYLKSDFGDQFKSDMFSIFEEVMKKTELRVWLNWDDNNHECLDILNQERLFNWLSFIDADDEHARQEPIIMKSAEIRELAGFINDIKAIQMMESTRSFSEGKLFITSGTSKVKQSLDKINKEVRSLNESDDAMSESDYNTLKATIDKMKRLLSLDKIEVSNIVTNRLSASGCSAFSEVVISKFRGISDLHINGLSRINLFVGDNNSGKTSVLEAVYMLTQMNNLIKYLDIERFRARVETGFSPSWMTEYLDNDYMLSGTYGGKSYQVKYSQSKAESFDLDKQGYLTTMISKANQEGNAEEYQMNMHLYEQKEPVSNDNKVVCICPSAFSSAYRRDKASLLEAYSVVIENNKKDMLVGFIRDNFDRQITDINLIGERDNYRFMVTSREFEKAMDITKYGEGLQRVLEISLYVVACENGCAFIDEIDSAVHKSLLDKFIQYIASICKEYNVQLFASTHNRECVDSFVKLKHDVRAYKLNRKGNEVKVISADAESLLPLIEQINMDIR